jgi:hypothetical protein
MGINTRLTNSARHEDAEGVDSNTEEQEMIVNIGEDWRITTIPKNYVIQQRLVIKESHLTTGRVSRAGQHKWVDRGYYSTLQNAANALPDAVVLSDPSSDLHVLMAGMESLRRSITRNEE